MIRLLIGSLAIVFSVSSNADVLGFDFRKVSPYVSWEQTQNRRQDTETKNLVVGSKFKWESSNIFPDYPIDRSSKIYYVYQKSKDNNFKDLKTRKVGIDALKFLFREEGKVRPYVSLGYVHVTEKGKNLSDGVVVNVDDKSDNASYAIGAEIPLVDFWACPHYEPDCKKEAEKYNSLMSLNFYLKQEREGLRGKIQEKNQGVALEINLLGLYKYMKQQ